MPKTTFRNLVEGDTEFSPITLQLFGFLIIGVVVVRWLITGDVSAPLLGTGGTLVGLGQYGSVLHKVKELEQSIDAARNRPSEEANDQSPA